MDSIWIGARQTRANRRKMLAKDETLGSSSDELIAIGQLILASRNLYSRNLNASSVNNPTWNENEDSCWI